MNNRPASRRQFLSTFATLGLGSTLLPSIVWAEADKVGGPRISPEMIKQSAALIGLSFSDDEVAGIVQAVTQNLGRYEALRDIHIPNDVSPPFYFSPLIP